MTAMYKTLVGNNMSSLIGSLQSYGTLCHMCLPLLLDMMLKFTQNYTKDFDMNCGELVVLETFWGCRLSCERHTITCTFILLGHSGDSKKWLTDTNSWAYQCSEARSLKAHRPLCNHDFLRSKSAIKISQPSLQKWLMPIYAKFQQLATWIGFVIPHTLVPTLICNFIESTPAICQLQNWCPLLCPSQLVSAWWGFALDQDPCTMVVQCSNIPPSPLECWADT